MTMAPGRLLESSAILANRKTTTSSPCVAKAYSAVGCAKTNAALVSSKWEGSSERDRASGQPSNKTLAC